MKYVFSIFVAALCLSFAHAGTVMRDTSDEGYARTWTTTLVPHAGLIDPTLILWDRVTVITVEGSDTCTVICHSGYDLDGNPLGRTETDGLGVVWRPTQTSAMVDSNPGEWGGLDGPFTTVFVNVPNVPGPHVLSFGYTFDHDTHGATYSIDVPFAI